MAQNRLFLFFIFCIYFLFLHMSSCYQTWKSRRSGGAKQIVFIFYFLYLFFIFTYEQLLPDMEKQEVWWRKIETGALQTTSRVPLVGKRISLGGEQRTITSGFFLIFFYFCPSGKRISVGGEQRTIASGFFVLFFF